MRLGTVGMWFWKAFTNYYKGGKREICGLRERIGERSKILGMNTDQRLDRLTERHEALAESLQLLASDVQSLAQSVKEHGRILRGHADLIGDLARIASRDSAVSRSRFDN